nr:unnamed protein product [Digitaria exilis]
MADPPPVAASASPAQADQLAAAASVTTPQNPNPNPLLSPQIPPSPTQLDPAAAAAASSGGGGSMDYPPRPPQLQAPSPTQAGAGPGGFGQIQRSGSASRLSTASQLPQYAAMAARVYGAQMCFSGGGGLVGQQQQQLGGRAPLLGQGQLGMLQGQGNAASAAHFGLQSQMMAQARQKGMVQGTQLNNANTAQALQGMQSMGVMGTMGMNQMRPNGTIPYGAQQRFAHAQMRPQASQQAALSPQVDPLGKVDPEVEDLLLEIADDFIDSVTAFACTLAKHRKSSVVEAKDVLLHLEKNWHMSVPGFSKEDKNPQRNSVKPSVDPQQPETDATSIRGPSNKLIANNSVGNHQIRPPIAEASAMPTMGPMSKVPRF